MYCKVTCELWMTQTMLDILNICLNLLLSSLTLRKDRCILCSWQKNWASFGWNDFLCFSSVGPRRSGVSYIERKILCVCLAVCQGTHSAGSQVVQCHTEWAGQHNTGKNAAWARPEKLRITMTTTGFLQDNNKKKYSNVAAAMSLTSTINVNVQL